MTTRTAEAFLHNHTFSTTETPIFLRMTNGHPYKKVEIATAPTRVSGSLAMTFYNDIPDFWVYKTTSRGSFSLGMSFFTKSVEITTSLNTRVCSSQ